MRTAALHVCSRPWTAERRQICRIRCRTSPNMRRRLRLLSEGLRLLRFWLVVIFDRSKLVRLAVCDDIRIIATTMSSRNQENPLWGLTTLPSVLF